MPLDKGLILKRKFMPYRRLALVLGHCLFPDHRLLKPSEDTLFFMAEDRGLCTHFKYHQHKLVLFLSAMRSHGEALRQMYPLHYDHLEEEAGRSYEEKLAHCLEQQPAVEELVTYDVEDHFFKDRLEHFARERGLRLCIVDSPGFIFSQSDFSDYLSKTKRPFLQRYYQERRQRLGVLVDTQGEPTGGRWSFDDENRKKFPAGITFAPRPKLEPTEHTRAVCRLVAEHFPDHPGSTENFNWATTREQCLALLDEFLQERLAHFGPYEDAIDAREVFAFHSVLSPYMNMGLITAPEVLERSLAFAERQENLHLPSLEGFVRQIMGWREFMRGIYHHYDLQKNYFNQQRRLSRHWYEGSTGIPPLDDSIRKASREGYTHHIERLMILGNIMLLSELHPDEVYRWFMEMYVDSADWVMAPNVYGMSQFAEGGIFATKPYVGGSNYIRKMSHYAKGPWCDIVDGLYWRFIERHQDTFAKNRRMSMMVATLRKMKNERRQHIFGAAEEWLEQVTLKP